MIVAPQVGMRVRCTIDDRGGLVVKVLGMLATVNWDDGKTSTINGAYLTDRILVYKIRDKNTGLYSTGGRHPEWRKNGQAFTAAGLARNLEGQEEIPASWEIVTFELVPVDRPHKPQEYFRRKS